MCSGQLLLCAFEFVTLCLNIKKYNLPVVGLLQIGVAQRYIGPLKKKKIITVKNGDTASTH